MKISSVFKAAATAAVLSGVCLSASAATTVLGPVSIGIPLTFQGQVDAGPFGDTFTFLLPANGGSGYSVLNFPVTIPPIGAPINFPGGNFNTMLSTISLYANPNGNLFDFDDSLIKVVTSSDPGQSVNQLSMAFGPTSGGSMYLVVAGTANGSLGGLYSGAISVTAVPEPESYAMLLAGLGVMGAIAVRRNKAKKQG